MRQVQTTKHSHLEQVKILIRYCSGCLGPVPRRRLIYINRVPTYRRRQRPLCLQYGIYTGESHILLNYSAAVSDRHTFCRHGSARPCCELFPCDYFIHHNYHPIKCNSFWFSLSHSLAFSL